MLRCSVFYSISVFPFLGVELLLLGFGIALAISKRINFCRSFSYFILPLHRLIHLSSVNRNMRGCINPKPYLSSTNVNDSYFNVVSNHDGLIALPTQNEHKASFPCGEDWIVFLLVVRIVSLEGEGNSDGAKDDSNYYCESHSCYEG